MLPMDIPNAVVPPKNYIQAMMLIVRNPHLLIHHTCG